MAWFGLLAEGVKSYGVAAKREHLYEVIIANLS
jgi:hypothetical protein